MTRFPIPPDPLKAAIDILADAFPTIPVSSRAPRTLPDQWIRVSQIGASMPHPAAYAPRILVECWATDTKTANEMARAAGPALANAAGSTVGDVFVRCWNNQQGPTDFPDLEVVDRSRWQFFGELHVSANPSAAAGS